MFAGPWGGGWLFAGRWGGWMLAGRGEEVLFVGLVPLIGERKLIWHAEARPQTVGTVFLWTAKRHCTKSKGGLEPLGESFKQQTLRQMCLRKTERWPEVVFIRPAPQVGSK